MNQHDKHNHDKHGHSHAGHARSPWYTTLHRNWMVWVAVGLMLLSMVVYVMSLDESIQPDGQIDAPVPAAN